MPLGKIIRKNGRTRRILYHASILRHFFWFVGDSVDILSEERLCKALKIDRGTLYKIFIKELGASPAAVIRHFKITAAKSIIFHEVAQGKEILKAVHKRVGYSSYASLARAFKKHAGVTMDHYLHEVLELTAASPRNPPKKHWKIIP